MTASETFASGGRRLALLAGGLTLAWTTLAAWAVHPMLPTNPVNLPGPRASQVRTLLPQGWAFFTRTPREARLVALGRDAGGAWRPLLRWPHAQASNAFGFGRLSRTQGVELGTLVGLVPRDAWTACEDDAGACLERAPRAAAPLRNTAARPALCGDVGLVEQEPVPWAWAGLRRPVRMPARVARLEVAC